jgi:hypothetical protein
MQQWAFRGGHADFTDTFVYTEELWTRFLVIHLCFYSFHQYSTDQYSHYGVLFLELWGLFAGAACGTNESHPLRLPSSPLINHVIPPQTPATGQ